MLLGYKLRTGKKGVVTGWGLARVMWESGRAPMAEADSFSSGAKAPSRSPLGSSRTGRLKRQVLVEDGLASVRGG